MTRFPLVFLLVVLVIGERSRMTGPVFFRQPLHRACVDVFRGRTSIEGGLPLRHGARHGRGVLMGGRPDEDKDQLPRPGGDHP